MKLQPLASALFVLALAACGGKTPPAACPNGEAAHCEHCEHGKDCAGKEGCEHCKKHGEHGHGGEHGEHAHGGEHGEHGHGEKLDGPLHDLHEVLAPIWHTEAGPKRVAKTCEGAKALSDAAKPVADAELSKQLSALEAACAKDGRAEVEATLGAAHERFHALVKAAKKD